MALAEWRARREVEVQVTQAWQTAAMVSAAMVGKLPKLEKLLEMVRPPDPQPARPLSLKAISRTLGLPMRPISPEALAALERQGLVKRG